MTIRLALIDDHQMVVEGLASALSRFEDLELVVRGSTTAHAAAAIERLDLDVVLLDVRLVDGNGLQVLARSDRRLARRVLIVSSFDTRQYAAAAAKFGAAGFVLKSAPLPALIDAIRSVATGGIVGGAAPPPFVHLSVREREVVHLAMEGWSNKEIAARLGLHRKTVEAHLSTIFERLEIHGGRVEMSLRAAAEGWLEVQTPDDSRARKVER